MLSYHDHKCYGTGIIYKNIDSAAMLLKMSRFVLGWIAQYVDKRPDRPKASNNFNLNIPTMDHETFTQEQHTNPLHSIIQTNVTQ